MFVDSVLESYGSYADEVKDVQDSGFYLLPLDSKIKKVAASILIVAGAFFYFYGAYALIHKVVVLGALKLCIGSVLTLLGIVFVCDFKKKIEIKSEDAQEGSRFAGLIVDMEVVLNKTKDLSLLSKQLREIISKHGFGRCQLVLERHKNIYGTLFYLSLDNLDKRVALKILSTILSREDLDIVDIHLQVKNLDRGILELLRGNHKLLWLSLEGIKEIDMKAFEEVLPSTNVAGINFKDSILEEGSLADLMNKYSFEINTHRLNYYIIKDEFSRRLDEILLSPKSFASKIFSLGAEFTSIFRLITDWHIKKLKNIDDGTYEILIDAFKKYCPYLTHISFANYKNITHISIRVLAGRNFRLKSLILNGCCNIKAAALNNMLPMMLYLTKIDLKGCSIDDEIANRFFSENRHRLGHRLKVILPSGSERAYIPAILD